MFGSAVRKIGGETAPDCFVRLARDLLNVRVTTSDFSICHFMSNDTAIVAKFNLNRKDGSAYYDLLNANSKNYNACRVELSLTEHDRIYIKILQDLKDQGIITGFHRKFFFFFK